MTNMAQDPVGITIGVIGTIALIAGVVKVLGLFDDGVAFNFKKDIIPAILVLVMAFCIWYSFPFAWMRGRIFDPIFAIIGAMIMAFAVMTGCIESESASKKRRGIK